MASESTTQHRSNAAALPSVRAAVLTISDTRTPETDTSGALMKRLLEEDGNEVVAYSILPDEPTFIREQITELCHGGNVQVILCNGGTGISPRDGTFEVVSSLIERPLPGFGELFRMLSWEEVGPAAMLSRATAGLVGNVLLFSTPGSSNAVQVAMKRLIIPELKHLVWEISRS
jgi:molybdenum cofactor biosynthesis protein B